MGKWILISESNCNDTKRLPEFNDWYNSVHVVDLLEVPGVIKATRYEKVLSRFDATGGRKGQYITIVEMEGESIEEISKTFGTTMAQRKAEGRYSKLLDVVSTYFYKMM